MSKAKTHQDEYFDRLAAATQDAKDTAGWMGDGYEGQLAVDVYQTDKDIIVRAAIAGVKADDIDIAVNNDMLTIKGSRTIEDQVSPAAYLYQECYWGGFSRTIILPVEVKADHVEAHLKNGILRIVLPKTDRPKASQISVVDEDDES